MVRGVSLLGLNCSGLSDYSSRYDSPVESDAASKFRHAVVQQRCGCSGLRTNATVECLFPNTRCPVRQLQPNLERAAHISSVCHAFQLLCYQYLITRGRNSSGEFHTFRLPVPSLWPDILEKVKAAGMNAVSVYTHMGLINPSPGVVDFDGFRALQPLYDAAKAAGIWIVLRPGNYS